ELAAFLAPEPIPVRLFTEYVTLLEEPLRAAAADPDALADTIGAPVSCSLAPRSPDGFQLHRLVQAVIRHRLETRRIVPSISDEDMAGWAAAIGMKAAAHSPQRDPGLGGVVADQSSIHQT
ncbi:SARP family transcriptional regulator, partial [Geodermatophilus sp. SYSU D00779]